MDIDKSLFNFQSLCVQKNQISSIYKNSLNHEKLEQFINQISEDSQQQTLAKLPELDEKQLSLYMSYIEERKKKTSTF